METFFKTVYFSVAVSLKFLAKTPLSSTIEISRIVALLILERYPTKAKIPTKIKGLKKVITIKDLLRTLLMYSRLMINERWFIRA